MSSVALKSLSSLTSESCLSVCRLEYSSGNEKDYYIAPVLSYSHDYVLVVVADNSLFAEHMLFSPQVSVSLVAHSPEGTTLVAQPTIVGQFRDYPENETFKKTFIFDHSGALVIKLCINNTQNSPHPPIDECRFFT